MTDSKTLLSGLMALMLAVSSCSKDNGTQKDTKIDENGLTSCAPNSDCRNFIYENRDFSSEQYELQPGNYRVFHRNETKSIFNSYLFIKVPMDASSFSLDKKDILSGRLKYITSCASCLMASSIVIDGYAKGVSKNAGRTKWIIEAQVIRQLGNVRDTMYLKQYFDRNLIID